ncbi:hypothetical protein [Actinocorallia populi]|uniref:hypothetical protein n=1 Tax=Actinocorallia populi TaxID=2079200 RepID=UPI000D08A424|nr:hypothetical protein [Actinocorallia populi]
MQSRIVISAVMGAVAGASVLVASAGAASATTPSCDTRVWADDLQGRPAGLSKHSKGGVYLWHARDGFHLRVTHRFNDRRVYAGSIVSPVRIHGVERIRKEWRDRVWLSKDRKTLHFRFVNRGKMDGVNFRTACASSLTVTAAKGGGRTLPPKRVYLGVDRVNPESVPFTVHRQD